MKTAYKILIFGLWALFASCGPNYYLPTSQNVPMLEEKGDANINAGISAEQTVVFQGAYAFDKNFAIKSNVVIRKSWEEQRQIENGFAYFGKLGSGFVYEVEGGFGTTRVRKDPDSFDMSFNRIYTQPMIGFTSDVFDFGISTKISRIRYNVDIYNGLNLGDEDVYFYNNNVYTLIEPGLTAKIGYKYVKLQFQMYATSKFGTQRLEGVFSDGSITLNFHYPFGKKENK